MIPRGYPSPLKGPSRMDCDAIKTNAFHDQGILVVDLDNKNLPWQERELLKAIGERLYGKLAEGARDGRKQ